jgi:hypothetical protein
MFLVASARITRLTLGPLLALWIAGAGCLFGCEVKIFAAEHHPTSGVEVLSEASGEACASSAGHSCCAKNQPNKQASNNASKTDNTGITILPGSPSGSMSGCPLAVGETVLVGKRSDDKTVAANPVEIVPKQLEPLNQSTHLPNHLRLPNRGHTYLVCCVFLI